MDMGKSGNHLFMLLNEEEIHKKVEKLAEEIDEIYGDEDMVAVCVLKGAFVFFSDLVRRIKNPNLQLDFVRLSSYGMDSVSSRNIMFNKDIEIDIHGKHVLLVEDIVDSGHTMKFLMKEFWTRKPESLRLAALIDKYERRETDITVDFPGFKFSKGFLVGYGLDFAEKFRTLPCIYEIVQN